MSTLYENEHQVQSVITRYQREAGDANRLRATGPPGEHSVGTLAMSIVHEARHLASEVRTHLRHAPTITKAGPPTTFLHFPE